MNQTPPGYPLGYILETTLITCGGCGNRQESTRLLVCNRTGASGRQITPTGASQTIYDCETTEVTVRGGTARCKDCITWLPREAVPRLPAPKAVINRSARKGEVTTVDIDLAALGL